MHRLLLLSLSALLWLLPPLGARAAPGIVGFEHTSMPDGTEIGIWYPSRGLETTQRLGLYTQSAVLNGKPVGTAMPLIVMSHGQGGSFAGHADTAEALAANGFVVAALTHPGDNWRDQSHATAVADRPVALGRLIDFMIETWPHRAIIDPARIGAFGFSAGGFTVLALAGGRPDLGAMTAHCRTHPDFFDCRLLRAHPVQTVPWTVRADARLRAIVVAAPALGFAFDRGGLSPVRIPVQLWSAANDHLLPPRFYANAVRDALPLPPEFHSVPDADHFDFLDTCADPSIMPVICRPAPGFDRAAFHRAFDAAVVRFFEQAMPEKRTG